MCVVDWVLVAAVLGGIGSIINAGLVLWLIVVTKKYVQINARILCATQESVQASQAQAETNIATFGLLRRQHEADLERSIGPVIGWIDEQLRALHVWSMYAADPRQH